MSKRKVRKWKIEVDIIYDKKWWTEAEIKDTIKYQGLTNVSRGETKLQFKNLKIRRIKQCQT